jgi:decaprenylphospho-beta-D-erythro-pentofuranosid-2-ulose 2-reductase
MDALGNPQSALVLGGGSDIAVATVRLLAGRRLERVVLAGRDLAPPAIDGVAVSVESLDVLDLAGHDQWVDGVFDRHDGFDVVLFAFGVLGDQELAERDAAEAVRIAQTNYTATVALGLAVARRLEGAGHGTIVVLSSAAGDRARRSNFVYGSSKAGADAFAQGLGDRLHGTARVVVVRPGFVHSKMTAGMKPAPLATTPEAVAEVIVRSLRGGREVVYAPGMLRWLFLVLKHLPRAVFRRLPIQ